MDACEGSNNQYSSEYQQEALHSRPHYITDYNRGRHTGHQTLIQIQTQTIQSTEPSFSHRQDPVGNTNKHGARDAADDVLHSSARTTQTHSHNLQYLSQHAKQNLEQNVVHVESEHVRDTEGNGQPGYSHQPVLQHQQQFEQSQTSQYNFHQEETIRSHENEESLPNPKESWGVAEILPTSFSGAGAKENSCSVDRTTSVEAFGEEEEISKNVNGHVDNGHEMVCSEQKSDDGSKEKGDRNNDRVSDEATRVRDEYNFLVPQILWPPEIKKMHSDQKALYKKFMRKGNPKLKAQSNILKSRFRFHFRKLREEMAKRDDFEELKQLALEERDLYFQEKREKHQREQEELKARRAHQAQQVLAPHPPIYSTETIPEDFEREKIAEVFPKVFAGNNEPFSHFRGLKKLVGNIHRTGNYDHDYHPGAGHNNSKSYSDDWYPHSHNNIEPYSSYSCDWRGDYNSESQFDYPQDYYNDNFNFDGNYCNPDIDWMRDSRSYNCEDDSFTPCPVNASANAGENTSNGLYNAALPLQFCDTPENTVDDGTPQQAIDLNDDQLKQNMRNRKKVRIPVGVRITGIPLQINFKTKPVEKFLFSGGIDNPYDCVAGPIKQDTEIVPRQARFRPLRQRRSAFLKNQAQQYKHFNGVPPDKKTKIAMSKSWHEHVLQATGAAAVVVPLKITYDPSFTEKLDALAEECLKCLQDENDDNPATGNDNREPVAAHPKKVSFFTEMYERPPTYDPFGTLKPPPYKIYTD